MNESIIAQLIFNIYLHLPYSNYQHNTFEINVNESLMEGSLWILAILISHKIIKNHEHVAITVAT